MDCDRIKGLTAATIVEVGNIWDSIEQANSRMALAHLDSAQKALEAIREEINA